MIALLVALLIANAEARHAPAARHPEVVLSEDYAPILWLAEDEPLYPMLPYAFAFDDAENDAQPDDLIDVADPGEIAGTFSNAEKDEFYKKQLRARPPGSRAAGEKAPVAQTLPDMVAVVERSTENALANRYVLFGHWDDFFRSQEQPLRPLWMYDYAELVRRASALEPPFWFPAPGPLFVFGVGGGVP